MCPHDLAVLVTARVRPTSVLNRRLPRMAQRVGSSIGRVGMNLLSTQRWINSTRWVVSGSRLLSYPSASPTLQLTSEGVPRTCQSGSPPAVPRPPFPLNSFLTKLDSGSSAGACTPKRRPAHTPARWKYGRRDREDREAFRTTGHARWHWDPA
jgi:hypothetical protein